MKSIKYLKKRIFEAYEQKDWSLIRELINIDEIKYPTIPDFETLGISLTSLNKNVNIGPKNPYLSAKKSDFDIGEKLGSGSLGKIYLVKYKPTQEVMAMKIMDKRKINTEEIKKLVENEIKIHSQIKNPNIVEFYGHFEDELNIYLLLEYCPGVDLYSIEKKLGKLSATEIKKYLIPVVEALIYLKSKNIIHRDIKPENILVCSNNIKLADFGAATYLKPGEKLYDPRGTPDYISPEIVTGNGYDYSTDIWSLGALIYDLAVGNPPFDDITRKLTYRKIVNIDYTIPGWVNPKISDLIKDILVKDPVKRPSLEFILNKLKNI